MVESTAVEALFFLRLELLVNILLVTLGHGTKVKVVGEV